MIKNLKNKVVIGLDEYVTIIDNGKKEETVIARIDSGAEWSSIDEKLFEKLSLGPIIGSKLIKSASGKKRRDIVKIKIRLKGKELMGQFNIADRSRLKYKMLIGHDILMQGFLIDPSIAIIKKGNKN